MQKNRLLNLLKKNARKGAFRAEDNTIYLYDMIVSTKDEAEWFGGVDAETFVQAVKSMKGDISLRINSPGGDVFAARAMAQAVREHDGKVTAHVDGYAASAASFLTSVAGETIMAPGSMLMIHKAWSLALGNSDDFMSVAALLEKIDGTIAETYTAAALRRGRDDLATDTFMELMAAETWLTGAEAVEIGLADSVSEEKVKASTGWDFSAYENAPDVTATDGVVHTENIKEQPEEEVIEQPRPNLAADLLLRPTA